MIVIVKESWFETIPPERQPFVVLRKRHAARMIIILNESWFEIIPPGRRQFAVLCKRRATRMIVIVEELWFETIPPERRPFVMLRKRHVAGIIVIVEKSWFETVPPEQRSFVVLHKRHVVGIIVIVEELRFETVPLGRRPFFMLRKRRAARMIVIIEESRFETVPPGRRPFVVLDKRCATSMIVIVQASRFETIPLGRRLTRSQIPGETHLKVQLCRVAESWDLRATLDFQHYRGVEGRVKSPGIRLGRRTRLSSSNLHPKTNHKRVSSHSGHPWVLGQTTCTLTHKTHHDPDSGEATTFPHIVFSTSLHGDYIQMAHFPGTPKLESRNCPKTVSVGVLGLWELITPDCKV
jgi:hypothetical protein